MTSGTEQPKLAAIMVTNMVGYSTLTQLDEALALDLLEEHHQILRDILPMFQGHEIKSTGDGLLVEFSSAQAAVQCAGNSSWCDPSRGQSWIPCIQRSLCWRW